MNFIRLYFLVILLLVFSIQAFPQKEVNNWCLEIERNLSFNFDPPKVLLNCQMDTDEGKSSVSDSLGNLLFYSDGMRIWNKNHDYLDGGLNLNGHWSTTQSCLIVKMPDSKSIYYVFTLDYQAQSKGVCYTIVDISLNNGLGKVISKNNLLYTPSTEKIQATIHRNQKDIWIVTHDWGNNKFRANLLTNKGINPNPIISEIGLFHEGVPGDFNTNSNAVGYMKISPSGQKIALTKYEYVRTYKNEWYSFLEIFDFDNCSGKLSNSITIDYRLIDTNSYTVAYGLEFSSDEKYLFVSSDKSILQFNLKFKTAKELIDSLFDITKIKVNSNYFYSALQMGPDKKIYVSYNNELGMNEHLGVINRPNMWGDSCNYNENQVDIKTGPQSGLPNFPSHFFLFNPYIESSQTCYKDSTSFKLKNVDLSSIKSIEWLGQEAGTTNEISLSTLINPRVMFNNWGEYKIRAQITTTTDSIYDIINNFVISPPSLFITKDTTICKGDTLRIGLTIPTRCDKNNSWKTINNSITFDSVYCIVSKGKYNLIVGDGSCNLYDSINVNMIDNKPIVDLGNDTIVCGDFVNEIKLDAFEESILKYKWQDQSIYSYFNAKNTGNYLVKCSNVCGESSDSIFIKFEKTLQIDLGKDQEICDSKSITLNSSCKSDFYHWNTGETDSIIRIDQTGNYIVEIGNSCGNIKDSVYVTVLKVSDLNTPNIITPNNDGLNEVLIVNKHLLGSKLSIYNRWGGICYTNEKYDNTWNANDLSDGVYYYEFADNCFNKNLKGWIQVAR